MGDSESERVSQRKREREKRKIKQKRKINKRKNKIFQNRRKMNLPYVTRIFVYFNDSGFLGYLNLVLSATALVLSHRCFYRQNLSLPLH